MNYLGRVVLILMPLLLVRHLLLMLVLVAMMLTPTTPLSHLLWSLLCSLCLQFFMSSTRASPMTRSPYWRESSAPYTSSARRGDHLRDASAVATPLTSSLTAPRGRRLTPPTSTTTSSGTTTVGAMTRKSTMSGTRRRRSSRRLCPEHVLPSATLTSLAMIPPAQRRMRRSSASQATSSTFASWASICDTSLTPTSM
jgi:hypothetical protein